MCAWTQGEVDKAISDVTRRAVRDRNFRRLLLQDPGKAIEQVSGRAVPEGYRIKVLEADSDYDSLFVLPPLVSKELTDSEIEEVAGGMCTGNICHQTETCER